MDGTPTDAIDRAILYELQVNGRRQITDIADELDVADNTVRNRLQKMEDGGVINGYLVDVNYDQARIQHHYVFTCTARVSEREELAQEALQLPGVVEVTTLMTGTNNVIIFGVGEEKDDITDLAYALDAMGLRIDHEHLVRRQVRRPYDGFQLGENL